MIWVINTNTNACHIYHYQKSPRQLTLLKEINHPENKLRTTDLVAGEPGHYQTRDFARGTYAPHMDAKDVAIDNFSREIAKELNNGRNNQSYEKLIVIAPPQMSGLLFQHLNQHVKNLIMNNIQKDLQHLKDHELLVFLQDNAQFPDK